MTATRITALAEHIHTLWLAVCVGGTLLPHALSATAVAGIVLVGTTLLTYEKDRRYPHRSWPAALRTFRATHEWSTLFVYVTLVLTIITLSRVSDSDPRGVCVLALAANAMLWLGAPRREQVMVQASASSGDTGPAE